MSGRSILLVEDNAGDVRLTREALREADVSVELTAVPDGEQALAFLRNEGEHAGASRPDLILLDLNLPRRDGREVLAEIKKDEELCRIPVVVLTTSAADEDILRSYQLHANAYVTKPVDFERFIAVVRQIDEFFVSVVKLPPKS
jgi:CheY-like chemotaxis protein